MFAFLVKNFSSYLPVKLVKCLFTNIQKKQNKLKSSLLFKKNKEITGKKQLENSQD